jgi:hypothetical protein
MAFEEIQLLLQSIAVAQLRTQEIVDSNSRAIQAMLDQAATDRLNHEARMEKLENLSEGLINIVSSLDEERPTILRKLNTIEQKTNSILDRLPPNN